MKSWLLFVLGTIYYFIQRYALRSKKAEAFSIRYWIKDNGPEFISVVIIDLAAMIILMDGSVNIDLTQWLPAGVGIPLNLLLPFLVGAGMGKVFYELFKKKLSSGKN